MRPSISPILSLLFFLFLFQHFPPVSSAARPDIIVDTCKRCSRSTPNVNYTLCVNSLRSVPHHHHRSDLRELGVVSVKLAIANAKHTKSKVKKLLKSNPQRDRYVKSCIKTCLEVYKDAISRLKDSAKAIKSGRYNDANIWISSAVDAPGVCEGTFVDGDIKSPLVKEDEDFFQLAVIALAITALLG